MGVRHLVKVGIESGDSGPAGDLLGHQEKKKKTEAQVQSTNQHSGTGEACGLEVTAWLSFISGSPSARCRTL